MVWNKSRTFLTLLKKAYPSVQKKININKTTIITCSIVGRTKKISEKSNVFQVWTLVLQKKFKISKLLSDYVAVFVSEAYLEPIRTSTMERFSQKQLTGKRSKKAPSYIFDWVLTTPQRLESFLIQIISKFEDKIKQASLRSFKKIYLFVEAYKSKINFN